MRRNRPLCLSMKSILCAALEGKVASQSLLDASRRSSWCKCRALPTTVTAFLCSPLQIRRGKSILLCDDGAFNTCTISLHSNTFSDVWLLYAALRNVFIFLSPMTRPGNTCFACIWVIRRTRFRQRILESSAKQQKGMCLLQCAVTSKRCYVILFGVVAAFPALISRLWCEKR